MNADDKHAAEDYRRQRQAASAKITGFKPMSVAEQLKWTQENREVLLKLIRGAGPPRSDEAGILEAYTQAIRRTSEGSQFDDVNARQIIERVIGQIEEVCLEQGIPTHAGVVYGSDAKLGLGIGQRAVLQTEASIIEVSIHFLSFSNVIAKLLARTFPYYQANDDKIHVGSDVEAIRDLLRRDSDLVHDWSEALTSFAATGVQPQGPGVPLNDAQNAIRTLLLQAIELFTIGHEYGHHSMGHGRVLSSEDSVAVAFQDEFAADLFGRGCSMAVEAKRAENNFYAESGAGGVLILGSLELIRRVRAVLETGKDEPPPRSHHPPYLERVANLAKLDQRLTEDKRERAADRRQSAVDALEAIWEFVRPIILNYHKSGIRPKQDPLKTTGWLPS